MNRGKRTNILILLIVWSIAIVAVHGCATMSTPGGDTDPFANNHAGTDETVIEFPPTVKDPVRTQVIRFGLDPSVEEKYPELREKRIGWGLCNRIVEDLFDSGRFEFIEDKEEIIGRMFQQISSTDHALWDEKTVIEKGKIKQPEYYIYAEVYDFAVSKAERIRGVQTREASITRIGIQVRMTKVATGEYIPGSAIGEAVSRMDRPLWGKTERDFDQSTVGKASELAIRKALHQLLLRWEKQ